MNNVFLVTLTIILDLISYSIIHPNQNILAGIYNIFFYKVFLNKRIYENFIR